MSKPKPRGLRGLVVNLVLMAVAFGLLGYTVYRNRGPIERVLSGRVDFRLYGLAFGIYMVALVLTFFRWYTLVRVIEPRFTLGAANLLGFIGNLFNLVIPGAVGGDFIKAAYLVRMDIRRTQAVASMVIDRILGLLGLFQLAGLAGFVAWPRAGRDVRVLIALVWAAVLAGWLVLALIFGQRLSRSFPQLFEGPGRRAGILRELRVMSMTYRTRLGLVFAGLLGSSAIHSLYVIAFYLVCRAIFTDNVPGLAAHFLIVPLTLFTTAVPIPFGALGVSENVGDKLGEMVGHPGGAVGMLGFRVLMYGGGIICALVYLANLKQVRGLTEAAGVLEDDAIDGTLEEGSPDPAREDSSADVADKRR